MENDNLDFLGTGWGFPPAFSKMSNSVEMVSYAEDIRQSLEVLLSTQPGERITQPEYGCDLSELIYEPLTIGFSTYIEDLIRTAIVYHEPRILLEHVAVALDTEEEDVVTISIDYSVRTTNSRTNYVYHYYIVEGTNL